MTIAENEPLVSGPYAGDGVTTVFDYDFKIYRDDELRVERTVGGATDVLIHGADYSVTGAGDDGGGTIVLADASRAPVGSVIYILPDIALSQTRPLGTQTSVSLSELEVALDKTASIDRQLSEKLARALTLPVGSTTPTTLPAPVVGTALVWGATGLTNGPAVGEIESAAAAAAAALVSAQDAEASAQDAEASAQDAEASAAEAVAVTGLALKKANNLNDVQNVVTARSNLGLGTAATQDVQADVRDVTAGRVVITEGALGAYLNSTGGIFLSPSVNIDNVPVGFSGLVQSTNAGTWPTGAPSGTTTFAFVQVQRTHIAGSAVQYARYGYTSTASFPAQRMYSRVKSANDTNWGPWVEYALIAQGAAAGDMLYFDGVTFARLPKGTSGQVLKMSGTVPAWGSAGGTAPDSAMFVDQKPSGTAGGALVANAWTARDLNTTGHNNIAGASLSGNAVTLPAGTYDMEARSIVGFVGPARLRLNGSVSGALAHGAPIYEGAAGSANEVSVSARVTLASSQAVSVQQIIGTTRGTTDGGYPTTLGNDTAPEIYTTLKITKVS